MTKTKSRKAAKVVAPVTQVVASPLHDGRYNAAHRCDACGCKLDHHSWRAAACPAVIGWGMPSPQPPGEWLDTEAGRVRYDAAMVVYWASGTTFKPRR